MIKNISIKNFKSLKNVFIETKSLNLLMGLNGMGKSSFIQVLLLLMQSDKLDERIIDLNGSLVEIGQGRDALYQFADEDFIEFKFLFPENDEFKWKLKYQKDKDQLKAESGYRRELMSYFREQTTNFQFISAERLSPQNIYDASSVMVSDKKQIGMQGEFSAYYLNIYGSEYIVPEKLRHEKAISNKLLEQLNSWIGEISPGISINTKYVPEINKVILDYQFGLINGKTNSFKPKNVGFGISYVLPVVLSLLTSESGKIIVIENPESHIHPRGQAEMGKLMALAASNGAQLFIETHSEHILNGIRVAVKDKLIDKNEANICYFEKTTTEDEQYSSVTQIRIDEQGELSEYPKDFLDEWNNQLLKLI
jgi:predicted ATPase